MSLLKGTGTCSIIKLVRMSQSSSCKISYKIATRLIQQPVAAKGILLWLNVLQGHMKRFALSQTRKAEKLQQTGKSLGKTLHVAMQQCQT